MLEQYQFALGIGASIVTIIAATASGIRYLGRAGVIHLVADRLGVELASLVIPEEPENLELQSEERNERARFLLDTFDPIELEEALRMEANEVGDAYTTDDLVELARSQVSHHTLIEAAIEPVGGGRRKVLLGEHLSDEELSDLLDERDLWPDPIEEVAQLEDSPDRAYAWMLSEDATEDDRASLRNEIEMTYVQLNGREPEAMHFIVIDIDDLQELDADTVENYVKPWLKDETSKEANG